MQRLHRNAVQISSLSSHDDDGYVDAGPTDCINHVWGITSALWSVIHTGVKSMLNPDYKDMLRCLQRRNAKFLVVGAYAIAAHGFPRSTMDIDFWV